MISSDTISLQNWSHNYDKPIDKKEDHSSLGKAPSTGSLESSSTVPLTIEKPTLDMILCPPKSTLRKVVFNPNFRVAQCYNVVEDLAQAPCAMSTLEVLQSCPTQRKNLLTTLWALDPDNTNLIHFNIENYKSRLPHKLAFHIITKVVGKKVFRTVLDGASTSVLSLSCWKSLGSLELVTSPTTLKAFDGWFLAPWSHISPHGWVWGQNRFYSSRSGRCPVRLQPPSRKKMVLCHDCYHFNNILNSPISTSRENCHHWPPWFLYSGCYYLYG